MDIFRVKARDVMNFHLITGRRKFKPPNVYVVVQNHDELARLLIACHLKDEEKVMDDDGVFTVLGHSEYRKGWFAIPRPGLGDGVFAHDSNRHGFVIVVRDLDLGPVHDSDAIRVRCVGFACQAQQSRSDSKRSGHFFRHGCCSGKTQEEEEEEIESNPVSKYLRAVLSLD